MRWLRVMSRVEGDEGRGGGRWWTPTGSEEGEGISWGAMMEGVGGWEGEMRGWRDGNEGRTRDWRSR